MLDFLCVKAWQTLAAITLVHSAKTRLSLSHHTRSTLRNQTANTTSTPSVNPMYFKNRDIYLPTLTTPTLTTTCSINAASSPRTTRCTDCRPYRRHAPALQDLVHVRLVVRTSNHIAPPPVNPKYFKNRDIYLPTLTTPTLTTTCSINAASSPRTTRCTDCRPYRRHAPALQDLVHVRLVVRTSNHIAPPRLIQSTSKTGTSIYQLRQHKLLASII